MAKKTILFVCNEVNFNIHNRRSAIDSILCSLLVKLESEYVVLVNGEPFDPDGKIISPPTKLENKGLRSFITKSIPKKIKEKIKIKRLLDNSSSIIDNIRLKNLDVDFVFELYKLGSNIGSILAGELDANYVLYYDSPVVEQYEELWQIKAPFKYELTQRQQQSIQSANKIICYSNPVKKFLESKGAKGTISIFQTLDYSRLTKVNNEKHELINIGFIGSFMNWHRVDLLIKSYFNLRSKGFDNIRLILVGQGECYDEVVKLVENSKYKNGVEFTGFIDGVQLNHIKSILDIGVMPGSNWYGMPTKVYEYGMSKIASLAPNTPTIEDLFVNHEEIQLFDWDDQRSLEVKLEQLIVDSGYRMKIAENLAKRLSDSQSPETVEEFYYDFFK